MEDYSFKTIKHENDNAPSGGADVASKNDYDAPTMKPDEVRAAGPKVGDKLVGGRYEILSELGRGGMGVVYRCFDCVSGIEVALKALPPELSHNSEEMEEVRDNFQLVSKLVHQNIAANRTLERDALTGDYYLVMELVMGENLRQWMRRMRREKGTITIDDALPILRQVAGALDYAHARRVMHRDIKPANIMLTDDGLVKVMDFGLAAQIHTSLSHVSVAYHGTSGTQSYMAPEQWRGMPQDAAADQYALAVMAYEMLAGHLPFDSMDPVVLKQAVLEETPAQIEGLPDSANKTLLRALSKKSSERFHNCQEFVASLTKMAASESPASEALNTARTAGAISTPDAMDAAKRQPLKSGEISEQQKQDVYLWQMELQKQKSVIDAKDYDRGQTFGVHLDSLDRNFKAAEGIMKERDNAERLMLAHQWYKRALDEVEWLNANAPLREKAKGLFSGVVEAERKAKMEGNKSTDGDFAVATAALATAKKSYEKGDFQHSISMLIEAKYGFERAWTSVRAAKIKNLLDAGCVDLQEARWQEAVKKANEVLKLEEKNMAAAKLKNDAVAGEKREEIDKLLAAARKAKEARDKKKAKEYAEKILALEPSNAEALTLMEISLFEKWLLASLWTFAFVALFVGLSYYNLKTKTLSEDFNSVAGSYSVLDEAENKVLDFSGVRLKMIKVNAGKFQMGSPENELGRFSWEKQHWVTLTQDYWLGETGVMQGQWKAVMGKNPSFFKKGDNYPVEEVSWEDAMEFCNKLNQKYEGRLPKGYKFSLPTEAQWEYACRAGTTTSLNNGSNITSEDGKCANMGEVGWYGENSGGSPHPVAQKRANAWGFYDMHGNVLEWCSDWFDFDYGCDNKNVTDPQGPSIGSSRVRRGGSWYYDACHCRAAYRGSNTPSLRRDYLGFRLALVPVQ